MEAVVHMFLAQTLTNRVFAGNQVDDGRHFIDVHHLVLYLLSYTAMHDYHLCSLYTNVQCTDNQEVYQDCSEESGAVVVIEILEHQSDVKNEDAITFFFCIKNHLSAFFIQNRFHSFTVLVLKK